MKFLLVKNLFFCSNAFKRSYYNVFETFTWNCFNSFNFSVIYIFSLNRIGIKINPFIFAVIFFISSSIAYYFIIRIIVDTESATLRLKLFNNNNKNIIKIDNINNLEYVDSASQFISGKNNSKFIICTPYYNQNGSNLISFETSKNVCVILSVNKPDKLYDILEKYNKQWIYKFCSHKYSA